MPNHSQLGNKRHGLLIMPIGWDPAFGTTGTFSVGTRLFTHDSPTANVQTVRGATKTYTTGVGTWDVYFEVLMGDVNDTSCEVGIGTSAVGSTTALVAHAEAWGFNGSGDKEHSFSASASGLGPGNINATMMVRLTSAGNLYFGRDGVWGFSGAAAYTGIMGTFYAMARTQAAGKSALLCAEAFNQTYGPPSGSTAWA